MVYFTLVTINFSRGETMGVNLVHKYLVEILEIQGSVNDCLLKQKKKDKYLNISLYNTLV